MLYITMILMYLSLLKLVNIKIMSKQIKAHLYNIIFICNKLWLLLQ